MTLAISGVVNIAFNETESIVGYQVLKVSEAMCIFQFRSDVMVIPSYLAD